jgi:hypothetical protein
MRDDSDYMQWFTDGDNWRLCTGIDICKEDELDSDIWEFKTYWHKATAEEIIEHFQQSEKNN